MGELSAKRCLPCEGGVPALDLKSTEKMLAELEHWDLAKNGHEIVRHFHFKNFYETMAFINAVAWIANQENHHPDMEVSYNHVVVRYSTHAIAGLTENDFICAAKIDVLFQN